MLSLIDRTSEAREVCTWTLKEFVRLSGNFFEGGSIDIRSVFLFVDDTVRINGKTIKHPKMIQEKSYGL